MHRIALLLCFFCFAPIASAKVGVGVGFSSASSGISGYAVNSKSDMRTTSYVTTTSTYASQEFLKGWTTTQEICGISANAKNCR